MKKRTRRGRRPHKRNPSSHPILAAIATIIVEGAASAPIHIAAKDNLAVSAVAAFAVPIAGYFIGSHYFPKSKTPILVGSVIVALVQNLGVASAVAAARKTQPDPNKLLPPAQPSGVSAVFAPMYAGR